LTRLICIGCPQGCDLDVEQGEGEALRVSGARCRRGREYARTELTDPRRTITTTVRVRGGVRSLVAVRSAAPVPKRCITRALREVKGVVLEAPVTFRQIVEASVAGTGIAVLTVGAVARDESTKDTGAVADQ
jgi:CxxC motif-containing protein